MKKEQKMALKNFCRDLLLKQLVSQKNYTSSLVHNFLSLLILNTEIRYFILAEVKMIDFLSRKNMLSHSCLCPWWGPWSGKDCRWGMGTQLWSSARSRWRSAFASISTATLTWILRGPGRPLSNAWRLSSLPQPPQLWHGPLGQLRPRQPWHAAVERGLAHPWSRLARPLHPMAWKQKVINAIVPLNIKVIH